MLWLIAIHGWELAALFAWLWWRDRQRPATVVRRPAPEATPTPVNGVRPAPEETEAIVQSLKGKWAGKDAATLSAAAQEIATKGREYLARVTAPRPQ